MEVMYNLRNNIRGWWIYREDTEMYLHTDGVWHKSTSRPDGSDGGYFPTREEALAVVVKTEEGVVAIRWISEGELGEGSFELECKEESDSKPEITKAVVKKGIMTMTNTEVWNTVEEMLTHNDGPHVILYGPPGTGKTNAAYHFRPKGQEVMGITVSQWASANENLKGFFIPKGLKGVEYFEAVGTTTWRGGSRLVINEINCASPDLQVVAHAYLDDPDIARVTLPTGETIRPAKGFRCVATMNGEPEDLPEALRDRFVAVKINHPHPKAYSRLSAQLQSAAQACCETSEPARATTFRQWLQFDRLKNQIGEDRAAWVQWGKRGADILNAVRLAEK